MLRRYDGLVPAIRGPAAPSPASASASAKASAATSNTTATTTVTRFTIQPLSATAAASLRVAADAEVHERRLYTFLPSADVAEPPQQLRVAPSFFADATTGASAVDDGDEEGSDASGDSDVEGEASPHEQLKSHNLSLGGGAKDQRRHSRRRRRGREPMRLEYQGIMAHAPGTAASQPPAKMASTPAPGYRHLTCVLLQLPPSWQQPHGSNDKGSSEEAEKSGLEKDTTRTAAPVSTPSLVTATALRRPVLQLWGERRESAAGADAAGAAPGISTSWYSAQSTRISKSDWKTMDAAEAEAHKPRNWSDDDGGGDADDGDGRGGGSSSAETAMAAREKKRAKAEATSQAVRTFLAGTQAALRQQSGVDGTLSATTPASTAAPPPPPAVAVSGKATATLSSNAQSVSMKPEPTRPRTLTVVAVPSSGSAAVAAAPAREEVRPAPTAAPSLSSAAAPPAETLAALSSAVLAEICQREGRATAPLAELQKRILKKLPDFGAMSQKMKAAETKREAVEWFQTHQRELRVWLQSQSHSIASDGTVTFGG